jgi:transient receptor potential cation channel subfamily M member 3
LRCGCGKLPIDHIEDAIINEDANVWKIQENTQIFQTNAFGTLEFQGADMHTMKAEYIRLSFDTKPQHIFKLFKSYWQLELPKLIISVHGGIANFSLQTKLKQAIERGLIKVADTLHIWIITAGTDTGVVKHIGDILKTNFPKYRCNIIAIGIAPWGVVNGRDLLIGRDVRFNCKKKDQIIGDVFI